MRTNANRGPFELWLYDLETGRIRKFTAGAEPQAIRFSRDGRTLLVGNESGNVELIDSEDFKFKSSLVGHLGTGIVGVDSLSDGRILSAGADGALKVWPRDGQNRLPHWYDGSLPFALSQDGRELAVAQTDGTVHRFDLNENRELPALPSQEIDHEFRGKSSGSSAGPKSLRIGGLSYSMIPGELMVAYSNLSVRTWRLDDRRVITSVSLVGPPVARPGPLNEDAPQLFAANSSIPRIVFSGDGRYAAWHGYAPDVTVRQPIGQAATTLMVWEVASGRRIVNEYSRISLGPDLFPKHLEFETVDGRPCVVLSEKAPTVVVPGRPYDSGDFSTGWDLTTGKNRSGSTWGDERRTARGSRSIEAYKVLSITETATGITLLQFPLGATATGCPRRSGFFCCSHDAKKLFMSTKSQRRPDSGSKFPRRVFMVCSIG